MNLFPVPALINRAISNGGLGYNVVGAGIGVSPDLAYETGYAIGNAVYDAGAWLWGENE